MKSIKNQKKIEKKDKSYERSIPILDGSKITIANGNVVVQGKNGKLERFFNVKNLEFFVKENTIVFKSDSLSKKDKIMLGTIRSHMKNMMQGVIEPFVYKLKVCSGHFPMNVEIKNNKVSVKNFLGEKVPRTIQLDADVDVKMAGEFIEVKSIDKEKVGTNAAKIEMLMKVCNLDRRTYSDGIYIINKGGKAV